MISTINSTTTSAASYDTSKANARRDEMFAKMDTNGDGTIDKAEFTAFAQQQQQANATGGKPSADEIFAQMDTNGDGSVSKAEFEALKPPKPHGTHGQGNMSKLFSKIDTDGDGKISKSEFEAFLEQLESNANSGTTSNNSSSDGTSTLTDYLNQEGSSSTNTSATYQSAGLSSENTPGSVVELVG